MEKKSETSLTDKLLEYAFWVLCASAFYAVIIKGAWWHMLTVAMCASVALAFRADARKEVKGEGHGQKKV